MKHVKDFFEKHPGCNQVHEALGYLFTEIEDAEKMLAGVSGCEVVTYDREAFEKQEEAPVINIDADTEAADKEVKKAIEEELPPVIHNDATTYGKSAEEVAEQKKEQEKNQKAEKESADKAKAKSKPKGK